MVSIEQGVINKSNLYFYTSSTQAQKTFFYPLCIGHFYCDSSYHIVRNNYDSFLIMFIKKGSGFVTYNSNTYEVHENQILFLDCYKSHEYYTNTGWETLWIHFDGVAARAYYNMIYSVSGSVISLKDTFTFEKSLNKIYDIFHNNCVVKEAFIAKYITNLLTELIITTHEQSDENNLSVVIDETIAYINEHISENLTLGHLATRISLSPYYFLRVFQNETGFTPHQYILLTRINTAKFYLKTTAISVKEIGFNSGFTSESSFCTTFKKWVHMTPSEYRHSNLMG